LNRTRLSKRHSVGFCQPLFSEFFNNIRQEQSSVPLVSDAKFDSFFGAPLKLSPNGLAAPRPQLCSLGTPQGSALAYEKEFNGPAAPITGRIDFSKYEDLQPLYTEYHIGNYSRSFQLSSKVEQEGIRAELKDGVMTLVLLKAEKAKARKITVS